MPSVAKKFDAQSVKQRKKWHENAEHNRAVMRNRRYVRLYGITKEQKDGMLLRQGGCAACGATDPGAIKGWQVDHDHVTGKVRGVLCHPCNTTLGMQKMMWLDFEH
jgi:hypothetical protein